MHFRIGEMGYYFLTWVSAIYKLVLSAPIDLKSSRADYV